MCKLLGVGRILVGFDWESPLFLKRVSEGVYIVVVSCDIFVVVTGDVDYK